MDISVYVTALKTSLLKKSDVMNRLLAASLEQGKILKEESPDMERFHQLIVEKDAFLREIAELDKGFDSIFARIGEELQIQKYQYQSTILEMQNLIRSITDTGMQVEGQEQKNKTAFQSYLTGERKEIKSFKTNNKMATSYYQNMANQHREWQSYFLDQKK